MKLAIILAVIALVAAAPETIRNKRQYPLLSSTTTTLHANPVVPVVQPVVVREFIHESMPVTEAPVVTPIVQSRNEEPVVQSNMEQKSDEQINQENVQTNSGLNSGSDVSSHSSSSFSSHSESSGSNFGSSHDSNMNMDTSSVTPLPFVSTTPFSGTSGSSGLNQDIIIPGMNTFSNIFTRAFGHELDPHLSNNGQAFPLVNGQSVSTVSGSSFPSLTLPNLSQGILPNLNQAGAILPNLNQAAGVLPLTQGILPFAQGLYNNIALPAVAPVAPITYSAAVAPIAYTGAYRAFPYYANPIVTESHHHVLPPRPAARQFPLTTTTTIAPEIHQERDAFPVKGGNVRSGVKGGDMGTRSDPIKGQHSI